MLPVLRNAACRKSSSHPPFGIASKRLTKYAHSLGVVKYQLCSRFYRRDPGSDRRSSPTMHESSTVLVSVRPKSHLKIGRTSVHRILAPKGTVATMAKRKKDPLREDRVQNELIVDAYGPEEQALGWYYYLENKIRFPVQAQPTMEGLAVPLVVNERADQRPRACQLLRCFPEHNCPYYRAARFRRSLRASPWGKGFSTLRKTGTIASDRRYGHQGQFRP